MLQGLLLFNMFLLACARWHYFQPNEKLALTPNWHLLLQKKRLMQSLLKQYTLSTYEEDMVPLYTCVALPPKKK